MTDYVAFSCLLHEHIFILCTGAPSNEIGAGVGGGVVAAT